MTDQAGQSESEGAKPIRLVLFVRIPGHAGPGETGRFHKVALCAVKRKGGGAEGNGLRREAMPLSVAVCRCMYYRGGKVKGEGSITRFLQKWSLRS